MTGTSFAATLALVGVVVIVADLLSPVVDKAKGAIRLAPEGNVARSAAELALPRNDWLVAYCA